MKLGTENRKQVIGLAVLAAIALVTTGRALWPSAPPPPPVAPQKVSSNPARAALQRTASGKFVKAMEPRLDPTLDLDLLRQSEQIKYAGTARNIFVAGSLPKIEEARGNGTTDKPPVPTPPVYTPPPINLKFFGFASKPGEPKKIFLSQGEDIFIAAEGDIVNRRYRILHISPAAVDIEDVLNNNRQSIPLTQG
ncbi:MAG: hypothetical protein HY233_01275 [Acidobacteriales bacterium]|nr:hypothetical protein [Candidatus Koribacter versatilis]MBI3644588.1 hypothetical protein [Terriglobales bacterium]